LRNYELFTLTTLACIKEERSACRERVQILGKDLRLSRKMA